MLHRKSRNTGVALDLDSGQEVGVPRFAALNCGA
jgi:hypothetical protein